MDSEWLRGLLLAGALAAAVPAWGQAPAEAEEVAGAEDAEAPASGVVFPPEIEALLRETSEPDAYWKMERCISTRLIRNARVLDDRHVVFELSSRKYYLVQFKQRCPRLRPNSAIVYESRTDRLCRLDQIQAANSMITGDIGPPCSIPGFLPVQPEQIALLKETLKVQRKAEIDAFNAEKAKRKAEKQRESDARASADG